MHRTEGARRRAATDASPPAATKAERVQLTDTLGEFRTALEEEIDAAERFRRHAPASGALDAR
jgi:hypothetical protein